MTGGRVLPKSKTREKEKFKDVSLGMPTFRSQANSVRPQAFFAWKKQAKVGRIKQEMQHDRNQEGTFLREKREIQRVYCYRDIEEGEA